MSSGGVLRHLIEERQSGSSHCNSPTMKVKGLPEKSNFAPPRRALSDESPSSVFRPQASMMLNKANSLSVESPPQVISTNFTTAHGVSNDNLNSRNGNFSRHDWDSVYGQQNKSNIPFDIQKAPNGYIANSPKCRPRSAKQSYNGHPKSNSAGDDSYYRNDRKGKQTDAKQSRKRWKASASVTRSKSLHSAEKSDSTPIFQPEYDKNSSSALTRTRIGVADTNSNAMSSQRSGNDAPCEGSGIFRVNDTPKTISDLLYFGDTKRTSEESAGHTHSQEKDHISKQQSSMVVTPSGMGGLPQVTTPQSNPHGPYYATVPSNPIGLQQRIPVNSQHSPISQNLSGMRGPPPPYPESVGRDSNGHPQRPNSLLLDGQVSRKKLEYGAGTRAAAGGLTSPAKASSNFSNNFSLVKSAVTPTHDASFHSLPDETISHDSYQIKDISSHPTQTQFTRNGSVRGYQNVVTTPLPQNAVAAHTAMITATATNNTASVHHQPRLEANRGYKNFMNSVPQKQTTTSPTYSSQQTSELQTGQQPTSAYSTNGYSLGKSDSNASTSSGGSRNARRNKRNSKNFSNASGSSSSTGNSRPNSSADYLERILSENEALKNQLLTTESKLKKYQNVEKELSRVTDDYHHFRLSVAKSESMQSTLVTQLQSVNAKIQQENETLRDRISTLTELMDTYQQTNKDEKTPSADIAAYKVKVQEMQARENRLNEQLEEAHDRISEQKEDISLLSSSLERMQRTVSSLKERVIEKQRLDKYAEELSPFLEELSKTVQSRLQAEKDLLKFHGHIQRQSSSSNDEGISEMDALDNVSHAHFLSFSSQMGTSSMTGDEQLVRAHAQMLKWQHTYLQTALMRELSTAPGSSTTSVSPLYSMLYKHRHAVSDPSFGKNTITDFSLRSSRGISLRTKDFDGERDKMSTEEARQQSLNKRKAAKQNETSTNNRRWDSTSLEKTDTSDNDRDPSDTADSGMTAANEKLSSECQETQTSNETDSPPSEGYHSQQSSGSPTPLSERSSLHFPEGDTSVSTIPSQEQSRCTVANQQLNNTANARQTTNPGLYVYVQTAKTTSTKVVDV